MEACYGGTDVMERSCAVARGIDINSAAWYVVEARVMVGGSTVQLIIAVLS
jgi:hypothetical protein